MRRHLLLIVSPQRARVYEVDSGRAVDSDALVIGAGPAGASAAIRLAQAGWRVVLIEQHVYPRQKVCGECIAAGNLALIDELGIGSEVRQLAGAELREVGWMSARATVVGDFPACLAGPYRFGRALGRDVFDSLLLERARSVGVRILQPAKVRAVAGMLGNFRSCIQERDVGLTVSGNTKPVTVISSTIIIDAHGSWEAAPTFAGTDSARRARILRRPSDLFAFKARFHGATLRPGLLPVLPFEGGYGGIVVADDGQTTLACCIRRDALQTSRSLMPRAPAGVAVEATLRRSCLGVRQALRYARRDGSWLSVGPIRPGIHLNAPCGVFRVGNAGGESHPLIGEGISMALQSAKILANELTQQPVCMIDERRAMLLQRCYTRAWKQHFMPRLRLAAIYAHVAMRPTLSTSVSGLLRRWPQLLTEAARFTGKARNSIDPPSFMRGIL
jgi:flavin-dependent dehydrogenase